MFYYIDLIEYANKNISLLRGLELLTRYSNIFDKDNLGNILSSFDWNNSLKDFFFFSCYPHAHIAGELGFNSSKTGLFSEALFVLYDGFGSCEGAGAL